MVRILFSEPDPVTRKSVGLMLKGAGIAFRDTDLADEAYDMAMLYTVDLILSETREGGLNLLKRLRAAGIETPIMFLSGDDRAETKLMAFGFGVDDYMTKPFHRDELIARIHAIVRRSRGHSQSIIRTGPIEVNLDAKTVHVEGTQVHLTNKEYLMMELLSLRKGATLTKEIFLNHLYGGMDEPDLKIIDIFISKLRRKLGEDNCIETIWGRGYALRDPKGTSA